MMIIGLTGGTGSGKSTVADYLKRKGCRIIDADKLAKDITEKDEQVKADIRARFGSEVFDLSGNLMRKKLAAVAFSDPERKAALESIVTRRVIEAIHEKIYHLRAGEEEGVAVIDAPLLFECGLDEISDENWLVVSEENIRKQRLELRDGLSLEEISKRMNSQMSDDEKLKRADFVIKNSGSLEELFAGVDRLWERINNERD